MTSNYPGYQAPHYQALPAPLVGGPPPAQVQYIKNEEPRQVVLPISRGSSATHELKSLLREDARGVLNMASAGLSHLPP